MDARTPLKNLPYAIVGSRASNKPARNKSGQPVISDITPRAVEAFKLLTIRGYRYTRLNMMHAFVGGSFKGFRDYMKAAAREPNNLFHKPAQQFSFKDNEHRSTIYEIGPKGLEHLWEREIKAARPYVVHPLRFKHDVMWNEIIQSIELGAIRNPRTRFLNWNQDILTSKSLPASTRDAEEPFSIPLPQHGKAETHTITPDGFPFGIARKDDDQTRIFFCALEADCDTESIYSSENEKSSIRHKFRDYITIIEEGIYRKHFGFPNLFVLFVTTNTTHKMNMMAALAEMTKQSPDIRQYFLFQTFPSIDSFQRPPAPTGHMLTVDYDRVGMAPFNFTTS